MFGEKNQEGDPSQQQSNSQEVGNKKNISRREFLKGSAAIFGGVIGGVAGGASLAREIEPKNGDLPENVSFREDLHAMESVKVDNEKAREAWKSLLAKPAEEVTLHKYGAIPGPDAKKQFQEVELKYIESSDGLSDAVEVQVGGNIVGYIDYHTESRIKRDANGNRKEFRHGGLAFSDPKEGYRQEYSEFDHTDTARDLFFAAKNLASGGNQVTALVGVSRLVNNQGETDQIIGIDLPTQPSDLTTHLIESSNVKGLFKVGDNFHTFVFS